MPFPHWPAPISQTSPPPPNASPPPPPAAPLQSQRGAELIWRFPILLDACANEVQRKGDAMMVKVGGGGVLWVVWCGVDRCGYMC